MIVVPFECPPPKGLLALREAMGLSQAELAWGLALAKNGERLVRRWEEDESFRPTPLAWHAMRFLAIILISLDKKPDELVPWVRRQMPDALI